MVMAKLRDSPVHQREFKSHLSYLKNFLEKSKNDETEAANYRVYKKRWLILLLYYAYNIINIVQWIQYSSIADVVVNYYQVSPIAINWSSMLYFLVFILFGIPGSYVIDKCGLRISILIGIIGTSAGAWVKVGSVHPMRYWVHLLGQGIVALFQVLILPVAPKLAAVWFGAKEVLLACSLAVMSTQIGIAIGFIIPPLIVKQGDLEVVEYELNIMLYSYAGFATILIPILYLWFDDMPPTPPSKAQSHVLRNTKLSFGYKTSLIKVFQSRSFIILAITYGVNVGSVLALSVLLNEIVLSHYHNAFKDIGIIGLLMMLSGIVGMFFTGVIITKFGKLKQIFMGYHVVSLIFTSSLIFLMDFGLPLVYFNGICLCFFNSSLLSTGYDLGTELTYPEPEAISGGLLTISTDIFGIGILYAYSYLFYNVSELSANIFLVALLLVADLLLIFFKFSTKRFDVEVSDKTINVN